MKYNVGQKVRIKSLEWYNENKNESNFVEVDGHRLTGSMSILCGRVMTIDYITVDGEYFFKEDENKYFWTDEMIEGLVEEETYDFLKTDKPYPSKADMLDNVHFVIDNVFNLPEGYEFKDENGNVIPVKKIILEKKKPKYPKTYEECCKILDIEFLTVNIEQTINDYFEFVSLVAKMREAQKVERKWGIVNFKTEEDKAACGQAIRKMYQLESEVDEYLKKIKI